MLERLLRFLKELFRQRKWGENPRF